MTISLYKKIFKFLIICTLFILLFLSIPISIYAEDTAYVWSNFGESIPTSTTASVSDNFLGLESGSAILIEQTTGQILYSHNSHEKLRPASVTKIMTILLIMEAIDNGQISLTDEVPCSDNASSMGGSQIWLEPGETLTVDEMLKSICVSSANDCSVAMAEYIAGSEEAFVALMNKRAEELNMNNTTFKNCHGLDEDGHVTTAYDISLMSQELLNNHPSITNYSTIWMDSLRDGTSELLNTNKLINSYSGITGLKTGSTSLALYNLSASASREGFSLIAVIMKGPTSAIRFSEAQKLLDYGFNTYSFNSFGNKDEIIGNLPVHKGISDSVEIVLENNLSSVFKKGEESKVEQIITIPDTLEAPILEGEKIGEISYTLDGSIICNVNLIANNSIEKRSLLNTFSILFKNWFTLSKF